MDAAVEKKNLSVLGSRSQLSVSLEREDEGQIFLHSPVYPPAAVMDTFDYVLPFSGQLLNPLYSSS